MYREHNYIDLVSSQVIVRGNLYMFIWTYIMTIVK